MKTVGVVLGGAFVFGLFGLCAGPGGFLAGFLIGVIVLCLVIEAQDEIRKYNAPGGKEKRQQYNKRENDYVNYWGTGGVDASHRDSDKGRGKDSRDQGKHK